MLQNTLSKVILVIGSSGKISSALKDVSDGRYLFVGRPEFDIQDEARLEQVFAHTFPSLVINSAAYTAVDLAESEVDKAYGVNAFAVKALAMQCKTHQVPLIHISTDYVFDGALDRPYLESDRTNPLSVYGKSKLAGEEFIKEILPEHIIIRSSWVFSEYGHNFVKTMVKLAETKDEVNIGSDQIGCPTAASNLSSAINKIANKITHGKDIAYGTYNYTDWPVVSWYEFACEIFELMKSKYGKKVPIIKPILSSDYMSAATRPLNSRLDCSLIERNFGIKSQDWHVQLEQCIEKFIKNKI